MWPQRRVNYIALNLIYSLLSIYSAFLLDREKTIGMVELFMVSLKKDIDSYGEQDDASGICGKIILFCACACHVRE